MASSSSVAAASLRFGRLWARGHETLCSSLRRVLSVSGEGATTYLQGLVTCDLTKPPPAPREEGLDPTTLRDDDDLRPEEIPDPSILNADVVDERLRATCFLDPKGRVLTDALLWRRETNQRHEYLVDVSADAADGLLKHLKRYRLRRSKVEIADRSDEVSVHVVYGTLNNTGSPPGYLTGLDPRHPSLGLRVLSGVDGDSSDHDSRRAAFEAGVSSPQFPSARGTYEVLRRLTGVAEGSELAGRTPLECNQELLGAVAFDKGCYLGQELTARTRFTGVVRKRIVPVLVTEPHVQVPSPWTEAYETRKRERRFDQETFSSPPLPRLSSSGAGQAMVSVVDALHHRPERNEIAEDTGVLERRPTKDLESDVLLADLEEAAMAGTKILDRSDGATVGVVVSPPSPGTAVMLAQLRLDRLGLLDGKDDKSSRDWDVTNRVVLEDRGGDREYRLLPYLPLWWPIVDRKHGKEREGKGDDDFSW